MRPTERLGLFMGEAHEAFLRARHKSEFGFAWEVSMLSRSVGTESVIRLSAHRNIGGERHTAEKEVHPYDAYQHRSPAVLARDTVAELVRLLSVVAIPGTIPGPDLEAGDPQ